MLQHHIIVNLFAGSALMMISIRNLFSVDITINFTKQCSTNSPKHFSVNFTTTNVTLVITNILVLILTFTLQSMSLQEHVNI